jgi:hypothetical protein
MNIKIPQTDTLLALLPPQRWKPSRLLSIPSSESIRDVLFSPDGKYLAALTTTGNLFISDKCGSDYGSTQSDRDFRRVLEIETSSLKNRCRAIAFNPVDNDHRLTIRTIDNQILTLDCATFIQGNTELSNEIASLDFAALRNAGNNVADTSIGYFYDRLFIFEQSNILRIRDRDNREVTVVLREDLPTAPPEQKLHQVRLFESGDSTASRPTLYIWRDGTLEVVSFDKDFHDTNPIANRVVAEHVNQFAVAATGLAAEYKSEANKEVLFLTATGC